MVTEAQIYWLTRLDYLSGYCWWLGFILTGVFLFLLIGAFTQYADEKLAGKYCWLAVIPLLVSLLILLCSMFIPTTKEMCAIKLAPKVLNNQDVQELPQKVLDLGNEWLNELSPKKVLNERKEQ